MGTVWLERIIRKGVEKIRVRAGAYNYWDFSTFDDAIEFCSEESYEIAYYLLNGEQVDLETFLG